MKPKLVFVLLLLPLPTLLFPRASTDRETPDRPVNILLNPTADRGFEGWLAYKETFIDPGSGDPCFAVRNQGYILQDVLLPKGSNARYALLFGNLETARINSNGSITGLPYLYGYMMVSSHGRILSYLQGPSMLFRGNRVGKWWPAFGVFAIPPETGVIRFFLNQAERKGDPQNGSLARFDDLGLYLFETVEEARRHLRELSKLKPGLREQAEAEPSGRRKPDWQQPPENFITPPRVRMQHRPCIAEKAPAFRLPGEVVLQCEVGPDGKASDCRVQRGLGDNFDRVAIEAVRSRWVFMPGTQNGKPVTGSILVEVPLVECSPAVR